MTERKKRSIVRGHKIYAFGGPPPRWKPVVDRSIPVDPVRDTEDDWIPDDNYRSDEVGDEAAALAFLDEVLGNVSEVVRDDNDATDIAADEERQS